jgi:hypothetical protein
LGGAFEKLKVFAPVQTGKGIVQQQSPRGQHLFAGAKIAVLGAFSADSDDSRLDDG